VIEKTLKVVFWLLALAAAFAFGLAMAPHLVTNCIGH
jgi:hypothetical protein